MECLSEQPKAALVSREDSPRIHFEVESSPELPLKSGSDSRGILEGNSPSEPACCPTCNQRLPKPKRVPLREVRACPVCADSFTVYGNHPSQRSCSMSCGAKLRQRERARPKPEPKPCAWCAQTFTPRKAGQECCSHRCRGFHGSDRRGNVTSAIRGEVPV